MYERLRRGERIEHYETVRVAKDLRTVNISLTVSPITDGSGKVIAASKMRAILQSESAPNNNLARRPKSLKLPTGSDKSFPLDFELANRNADYDGGGYSANRGKLWLFLSQDHRARSRIFCGLWSLARSVFEFCRGQGIRLIWSTVSG